MAKQNPNSRPVPFRDPHDDKQQDKLEKHEADIAKLDRRPPEKGGRGC
jgi:hypothetical protein